jgi:hypothetical protein
LALQVSA